ncbi:MAG: hypothetical protein RLZ55_31, partial [Actinomycetota bacterium]
ICGGVLARAHARGGDASLVSGYLGTSDAFDKAVSEWAIGYADLNLIDYHALTGAATGG